MEILEYGVIPSAHVSFERASRKHPAGSGNATLSMRRTEARRMQGVPAHCSVARTRAKSSSEPGQPQITASVGLPPRWPNRILRDAGAPRPQGPAPHLFYDFGRAV